MIHRKKIKINGHCGIFANILSAAATVARLKKNISIMETAQKVQKIRLPPPRHLAGINKIFAIPFYFERTACPDLSGFS